MDKATLAANAIVWRRHLHAHPELSFEEHETSRFVHETLASFGGLELARPTATSVVARLQGGNPGRTLALRADIDGLPIQEASGVEFASGNPGVMHACGHDGHTATLLAVARGLLDRRTELAGEIRFVFQHAEEVPPGGAAELVAAGALDAVDAVIGAHLVSTLEVGRIGVLDGPCTAAADLFSGRILGRGGHAAFPHLVVDPIATAAQAVSSLQHVVSRNTKPVDTAVVSVSRISGGTADNIIPDAVEFSGTVRTYRPQVREQTREAMERILAGVTSAHGADYEFQYTLGYDPVVNDSGLAALVREAAGDRLTEFEPIMAGDDFSAYQQVAPGCFFFVGAGGEGAVPHHHPRFTIDDEGALPVAIETMTRAALSYLGGGVAGCGAVP